ncbi:hypothetical protein CROQUDRAFT_666707 [Cronartium quercuum f. sp. fusiforme G11]|uniref:Major facilitator superfamily (MFS) profile domain-containing protein n=1 Tax=Cronartium quercuum f. sp. fusiforme G11 TaxID=708437 RepID=A0A9P6N556_9BASI|nr:hypothetical protein CROQUDRAFT_666707 [Cronartium quercuum f. sp. fusiforme G11]
MKLLCRKQQAPRLFGQGSTQGERTPLVSASNEPQRRDRTPLPVKQLLVLCCMRLTEPISYTLIFPFINQMLEELKVCSDPRQIGYYAGVIESLFAIAQMCTAVFWGRLSDQVGRKPIMLIGLFGMAISVISFGFQTSYLGLVISRFLAGMMNGNIGILQSIVAEITDSTNYVDAAALLPLCYAIGAIVGPIIGGFLAVPAEKFPDLFGSSTLLIKYPYCLPCFIGGLLNFLAIFLGIFFLKETLQSKRKPSKPSHAQTEGQESQSVSGDECCSSPSTALPSIASLCTMPIMIILGTFILMHMQNVAWAAVFPLYAYTDKNSGGLGLSLAQIGSILSVNGVGMIFVQLLLFPPLQRRFGVVAVLRWTITCFTFTFLCLPFMTWMAGSHSTTTAQIVAYMVLIVIIRSPGSMCYVSLVMMVKLLSPSSVALGTLNGMLQTCGAFAQVIGPMLGSSLFAMGISSGILGGNLVWIVLALIAVVSQLCTYMISSNVELEDRALECDIDYGTST